MSLPENLRRSLKLSVLIKLKLAHLAKDMWIMQEDDENDFSENF